ncbi:unnamed protein product [Peniophora sp. CBMAI 1063]|nr:unnamed protein product [Peniophora sp. CBMAI 1063]
MDTETAGNRSLKVTSESCPNLLAGERFVSMDYVLARAIRASVGTLDQEGDDGVKRREDSQNGSCSRFSAMMVDHKGDLPSREILCEGCRTPFKDLQERDYVSRAFSGVYLSYDIDASFRLKHMPVDFQGWKDEQEVARMAAYGGERSLGHTCLGPDRHSCSRPDLGVGEETGDDNGYESDVPPLIVFSDDE